MMKKPKFTFIALFAIFMSLTLFSQPEPITTIETPTLESGLCDVYDVDITVQDFTNVGAISLALNFDPAVIGNITVTNLYPGLSSNFPSATQLRVAYFGSGLTLGNNDVLFSLHFDLLPANSLVPTDLSWSTVPGECEYGSPGGVEVYISTFNSLSWDFLPRSVKNQNTLLEYCTIQAAIDDPATLGGHVITVAPGIYPEEVLVTKALSLRGANYNVDCNSRTAESIIEPGYGNISFDIQSNGVEINGFEPHGETAIRDHGYEDVAIRYNYVIGDAIGIDIKNIVTTNTEGLDISNNCLDQTTQWAGYAPTIGISLYGLTGTKAAIINSNNIKDSYYGYYAYNLNTLPLTIIQGGNISQVSQGISISNVDVLSSSAAPSSIEIKDIDMDDFFGNASHIPDIDFHAGIYSFTGGPDPTALLTIDVSNVSVDGTDGHKPDCAGMYLTDWSTTTSTMQNITVSECTLSNNKNRGVFVSGYNALVEINTSTLTNNGYDPHGLGGNHGFGIITRQGGVTSVENCFITNPATVTAPYNVHALFVDKGAALDATINATNNSLSQNGNTTSWLASNPNATMNATCNWWGTSTVTGVAAVISGNVNYAPWWLVDGTDNEPLTPGFQPVPGSCHGGAEIYVNDASTIDDGYTTVIGNDITGDGSDTAPFLTISKAVSWAVEGTVIYVDAGTYQEQVEIGLTLDIVGLDRTLTIVKAPASMVAYNNSNGDTYPIFYPNGIGNTINISKLTIDGDGGRTIPSFVGIHYFEANGTFENNRITGIRDATFSGTQSGVAFTANHTWDADVDHTVIVHNNIIDDYQKGGIVINELNTHGIVTDNIVTGQNIPNVTGQNGIQFGFGAYGTITGNTVTNNIWNAIEHPHTWTAAGILLAGVGVDNTNTATGTTTIVGSNILNGNEHALSVGAGGFGYDSNLGLTLDPNTFNNNKIHVGLDDAGTTVPNPSDIYDKRVDNPAQTNWVYGSIQWAVDEAANGDELNVSPHTFSEDVTVWYGVLLKGANFGIPGCDAGRVTESIIDGGAGTAVTINADNATIDGFEINGFVGVQDVGYPGLNVSNNNINAESNGIGVVGVNTSTASLTIQDNCIDMTAQLAGGTTPNAAIGLNGISGTNAALISDNILTDGYYGYLVYNLTTVPATNISGGTITGFMQGLATVNIDPLNNTVYNPSNFEVSDISMSGFTGDYSTIPALAPWDFHAGIYVFTGGGDITDIVTMTITDVSVTGTGGHSQASAGMSFADFSTATATMQNITINTATISGNLNRGINVRGVNALVDINACTMTNNGGDSYGTDGNDGFGIISGVGAMVTVDNCYITNPLSSTYTVSALATSTWGGGSPPGGILVASNNSLDQNGNGYLANNAVGTLTATCNWWGYACGNDISPLISGTVDYSPWLLDGSDSGDPGFVPGGTCAGELLTSVITVDATVCYGTSTDLEITFTGVGPFTYAINSGTPVVATNNPETVTVSPTITTEYTITSLSDAYCTASGADMTGSANITVNPLPELTAVSMQASTTTVGPPFDYLVSGDLSGYDMCITPAVSDYFLDIDMLTSTVALEVDFLNPFYLSVAPPTPFFDYWAIKGVVSGATGWQAQMWEIINGNQPFFYIKHSTTNPSGYILVDGLQYWAAATPDAEPILQVPGDYPNYTYTYTGNVTDINACISDPIDVVMSFNSCSITGTLTYNNTAQTALDSMTVTLNSVPPISSPVTGGNYSLADVPSGTYSISVTVNGKKTGGINSTDAAQINFWGTSTVVTPWTIEKVRFYAGDVDNNNNVLSSDAQQVLSYFVNPGSTFTTDWKFWTVGETIDQNPAALPNLPSVDIGSTSMSHNLYGLCTGDFNQSFTPATVKAASESLVLKYDKTIYAETGDELELPIYTGMDMDVGAVSLILNFPSDKVDISEVFFSSDPFSPLLYHTEGDEIRIGWNSLIPVYLSEGKNLITLKLKIIDANGEDGIVFSLAADPLNELANASYTVINDAVLVTAMINKAALGMGENNLAGNIDLSNHPNPFIGTTTFEYTIPVDGRVILEIYDLLGNKVMETVDEVQNAGNYTKKLQSNLLQPGVYTAILRLSSEGDNMVKAIKIISR